MKKIILAIAITVLTISTVNACEICGCGIGNYHIGMMPQFSKKFIGLRYQYRRFNTVMADDPTQFSHDYYKTLELWGGWNIGKRWQVIAILPVNFIHQVSDDGTMNNQGLGDIALMVNYKVLDIKSKIKQQLWLGTGVKLPTGKFNIDPADPAVVAMANTQTGSASTDFMLNGTYNVTAGKLGITTSASYKMNTRNKDKYSFGNRFSISSFASYTLGSEKFSVLPNIGLLYENAAASKLDKVSVAQTGGNLLAGSLGLELGFKQFSIGTNVQLPISQSFASGQTEMKVRGMLHLSYGF